VVQRVPCMQSAVSFKVLWFTTMKACINTVMVMTGWKQSGRFKATPKQGESAQAPSASLPNDNSDCDKEKFQLHHVHDALSKVCLTCWKASCTALLGAASSSFLSSSPLGAWMCTHFHSQPTAASPHVLTAQQSNFQQLRGTSHVALCNVFFAAWRSHQVHTACLVLFNDGFRFTRC
jgi:hypothetical protein